MHLQSSDERLAACPALAEGKLLRAGLVILAGCCYGGRQTDLIRVGTAVELIHAASLLHDDLLDGAGCRRGHPVVSTRWSGRGAMLLGDYLLARAFQTLSSLANLWLMQSFSTVVTAMCEAELEQMQSEGQFEISEESYCRRIAGKTASFMAECCRAGSRLAGAHWRGVEALGEFGHNLGMAYQMLDDLRDYNGDAVLLGKPVGSDVRGGVATIPLILARESGRASELHRLWLERDEPDALAQLVELVRIHGSKPTLERVGHYADRARQTIKGIWPQPAREALAGLVCHLCDTHQ